jgi:hypothetical protein
MISVKNLRPQLATFRVAIFVVLLTVLWSVLHVWMVKYPDGAWNDDWISYYASSFRYLSGSGPFEPARVTSSVAVTPGAGTFYDRLLLNALLSPSDPYLLWDFAHAQIVRFFHLPPDQALLSLQIVGTLLYFFALVAFATSLLVWLAPNHWQWLVPLTVVLQLSYFGDLLFVGPSLFIPAMFLLPFCLLFFATLVYERTAVWRMLVIALMLMVHTTGVIVVTWCLMGSALYAWLFKKSLKGVIPEFSFTILFYGLMQGASYLGVLPSLYPETVNFFEPGFDFYGAISTAVEIKVPFILACVVLPYTLWNLRRDIGVNRGASLLAAFSGSFIVSSLGLISLRVKEGVYHIPLHRFYYAAWPAFVFTFLCVLTLSTTTSRLRYRKMIFGGAALAVVLWNVNSSVAFWSNVSNWRQNSNCRFLYNFLEPEIRTVARKVPDFVTVFDTKVAGAAMLLAGAGDNRAIYTRLTPGWARLVAGQSKAVLTIIPLARFLPFSEAQKPLWWNDLRDGDGPLPPVVMDVPGWQITRDSIVSQTHTIAIREPLTNELVQHWVATLSNVGPACDRRYLDSLYRVTLYEKAAE